MAKTPEAVRDLLMAVWTPARARAEEDAARLQELMREDGVNDALAPWDWRRYAAIRQRREHDLDEAEVKPFLQLDAMIAAAFDVAGRLFGLEFLPFDAPLHHPDARAWEVRRGGRHMGVFIGDHFARPSKRSGAWCSSFRGQSKLDGEERPIAINVCNFAKAPAGRPTLLTFDDARTLFHEMGHALHVLMSDVTHPFVSGTSVARDFVELPSQLYEHWLSTPEVLSAHARHAETGEAMPRDLLDRLLAARDVDQGFATVDTSPPRSSISTSTPVPRPPIPWRRSRPCWRGWACRAPSSCAMPRRTSTTSSRETATPPATTPICGPR
jgi:peptidyl-dipeptidase Dcp